MRVSIFISSAPKINICWGVRNSDHYLSPTLNPVTGHTSKTGYLVHYIGFYVTAIPW